jgi:hypothetical protein
MCQLIAFFTLKKELSKKEKHKRKKIKSKQK